MKISSKIVLGAGIITLVMFFLGRRRYSIMLDETSIKKLSGVLSHVRAKAKELAARTSAEGIVIGFNTGYRSPESQQKSYEGGKSGVKPGKSWHQVRRALDFYVVVDGKKRFDALDKAIRPLYERVGAIAEKLGFKWLGYKVLTSGKGTPFQDPYHIEIRDGLTIAQAHDRLSSGVDKIA